MRSKLFVPGSRPELFAKALASAADALSFDVEDSVPEEGKERARDALAAFLEDGPVRASGKLIIVRINAMASRHFEGDLMAFVRPEVALLNLPKAECAADVRAAVSAVEQAEKRNSVREPVRLLVNIETAKSVRLAAEIADAHPRVSGLQLGLVDLFESLRIDRGDLRHVHSLMMSVRLAAGESGRFVYDSAFPDVLDEEGFRCEARVARGLGYVGKSCVHPKQVALANEIFAVDELDLEQARRIVDAARGARATGRGAFLLEGRMIDAPIVRRAEALLAEAGVGRKSP